MKKFTYVEFRGFKDKEVPAFEIEIDSKSTFDWLISAGFQSKIVQSCHLIDNESGKLVDSYRKG